MALMHKFKTGQRVTLAAPARIGADRPETFEVIRLLPEERGIHHYRLKSAVDGHERVASEGELVKFG